MTQAADGKLGMQKTARVLIVDDSSEARRRLATSLSESGFEVFEADSGVEGRDRLDRFSPDVLIAELDMADGGGLFLLKTAQALDPRPRVIGLSARGGLHQAVEAMQTGAMTVLPKPVDADNVRRLLEQVLSLPPRAAPNPWVAEEQKAAAAIDPYRRLMRGHSAALERAYRLIARVAPSDTHVLVTGESGVGKELVAKEVHAASRRAFGPLVIVNCAAIPDSLLESELFGHKKGAFTNATSDREGRFRQAEGGTIFLDEIGEMKLDLQAKLLRVLQEREFQPIGGNDTIKGDFRVIAATNQRLEELVESGRFRKDLYYRLSVFPIHLEPLRERKEDVPALVATFIEGFNADRMTRIDGVTREVMERLVSYEWPGNVRELRNVVERMVILRGEGRIELEDLPDRIAFGAAPPHAGAGTAAAHQQMPPAVFDAAIPPALPSDGVDLNEALRAIEVSLIRQALDQTRGNKNRAAKLLRINRTTLVEKIKRLGIE